MKVGRTLINLREAYGHRQKTKCFPQKSPRLKPRRRHKTNAEETREATLPKDATFIARELVDFNRHHHHKTQYVTHDPRDGINTTLENRR